MRGEEGGGPEGRVRLTWLNDYACVLVEAPGARLIVDPVDIRPEDVGAVDAILITHEHYDHLDADLVATVQSKTGCLVVADPTSSKLLSRYVAGNKLITVQPGSQISVGEAKVLVEECNHPPASTPVTFLIRVAGITIYHTADSLPFPRMADIGAQHKPDVVFCTVSIAPGTSPATGAEIAKLTKPKVAIPYHTKRLADLERFCDLLAREAPEIRCVVLEKGQPFTYP